MARWRARPVHWLLLGIALSAAIAAVLGWRSSAHTPVIHIGINSWTGYDPLILAEARQGANPPVSGSISAAIPPPSRKCRP